MRGVVMCVSFIGALLTTLNIKISILRGPGSKPIDVAVKHAEGGGDEYRVVYLSFRCSFRNGCVYLILRYGFSTVLHAGCDRQQGLHLLGQVGLIKVCFHLIDVIRTAGKQVLRNDDWMDQALPF